MAGPMSTQCQEVNNLLGHIVNTTFLDTPIVLLSDTDTIRTSDTIQCIMTFLMTQTTIFFYDMNQDGDDLSYAPASILFHGDLLTFNNYPWRSPHYRRKKVLNGHARVLVVEEAAEKTLLWLQVCFARFFAVEVTVAVLGEGGGFYTWFPYRSGECGNVSTLVKLQHPQLFPRKIFSNLQGCPIAAFAFLSPPYVIDQRDGIEIKVLAAISQSLNLTVTLYFVKTGEKLGGEYEPMEYIYNNEVDMSFGTMINSIYLHSGYDVLTPHSHEIPIVVCPRPKPINRMVLLIRAFPVELWVCVAVTFLAIYVTCHFLESSALQAWALILGLPHGSIRLNLKNIFNTFCYLTTICIVAAYQARLFQLLQTVPKERGIKSAEELLESEYTFNYNGADPNPVVPHPDRLRIVKGIPSKELTDGTSYAYIPKSVYMYYFQNKSWYHDDSGHPLHIILEEKDETQSVVFGMSPGHPLRDIFSKKTSWLVEGGFPDQWKSYLYKLEDNELSEFVNTPITLLHVEAPFYILFFGHLVSMLSCLVEYAARKWWSPSRKSNPGISTNFGF